MNPKEQRRTFYYLDRLLHRPPKVLLLEGQDPSERERVALHWAAVLNCTDPRKPCGSCSACRRISDRESLDLHYLDGREGRIGIDAVRDLRPLFGQAPRDGGRRVIILGEAHEMTPEAANALLKSMEDTDDRNFFVLLAPQRERLLPTVVSRSWVLNLGWGGKLDEVEPGREQTQNIKQDEQDGEWLTALEGFFRTGRGWFDRTMVKSQVDKALAARLIAHCRRSLIQAMLACPQDGLARFLHGLEAPALWRALDVRLIQAEQALMAQVSPALTLDWLVAGFRVILQQQSRHCR